jgi:hypothetical protein
MVFRGFALLVAAAAVAGVVTLVTRLRKRRSGQPLDGRTADTTGSFSDDIRGFLRSIFSRGPTLASASANSAAIRLYQEVLRTAEASGRVREAAMTSREFAPVLSAQFQTPVTDDITHAFEQARYAGREPNARELAELEARWRAAR